MGKLIKFLMLVFIGLCIVMLTISLFMPDQVMTSKWVIVYDHKDSVINKIANLKHWTKWNVLLANVENITYSDSIISWTASSGKINQIKLESISENGISTPISIEANTFMKSGFSIEKRAADSVQIVWFIIEDLKWYPWEKFYGMMAADMKGPLMQKSLENFKRQLDSSNVR